MQLLVYKTPQFVYFVIKLSKPFIEKVFLDGVELTNIGGARKATDVRASLAFATKKMKR